MSEIDNKTPIEQLIEEEEKREAEEKKEAETVEKSAGAGEDAELQARFEEFMRLETQGICQSIKSAVDKFEAKATDMEAAIVNFNIRLYRVLDAMWSNNDLDTIKSALIDAKNAAILLLKLSDNPTMIEAVSQRYLEIKFSIDPSSQKNKIVREIVAMIGTASELRGEDHLNTMDSFLMIVIAFEFLTSFKETFYSILEM